MKFPSKFVELAVSFAKVYANETQDKTIRMAQLLLGFLHIIREPKAMDVYDDTYLPELLAEGRQVISLLREYKLTAAQAIEIISGYVGEDGKENGYSYMRTLRYVERMKLDDDAVITAGGVIKAI